MHPPSSQQCKPMLNLAATLAYMAENCVTMKHLKQVHAHSFVTNLHSHSLVVAKILRFAAVSPSGDLCYAHLVFDRIPQPNTFFHNTLIRGYAKSLFPWYSVCLFNRMRQNCVDPDEYSFNFLIKARSRVRASEVHDHCFSGEQDEIHGAVVKLGFRSHLFVQNALIHLYAVRGCALAAWKVFDETVGVDVVSWSGLVLAHVKAGELERARWVFDQMPEKDVVSWTAIVSGYAKAKRSSEALDLFWDMRDEGMKPDEVTLVSVISACADLGDLETGIAMHTYICENGFGWMISLCNALIGMYAKCGSMDRAWKVFNDMRTKSLVTWNSMISACANCGDAEDVFGLFSCMLNSGVAPDGVTCLAVLNAYAHKGMVDEGCRFLETMERDYGVQATIEHYSCVMNMLGRAEQLEKAYELTASMSLTGKYVVWEALLTACQKFGDVSLTEKVMTKLSVLTPDGGGYSNSFYGLQRQNRSFLYQQQA